MRTFCLALLGAWLPLALAAAQPVADPLARHLDAAVALDAASRAGEAQRAAAAARGAAARTPLAGSPYLGGAVRSDTRGPRDLRELDLEAAAPFWLPGQRGALQGEVDARVDEAGRRLALRRLEVAGLLRDLWWDAQEARRAAVLARDRLGTARQIGQAVSRRAQLGDIPPTEALLARGEVLASELAVQQAEAAATQAFAAYRALTGGLDPDLPPEPLRPAPPRHPALAAAEASLAAAEARARFVAATPRDAPELGLFGRQEAGVLQQDSTSVGLRLRVPLATEARNAPRRADAQADITRAAAELAQSRRLVESGAARAEQAQRDSERTVALARQRLAVAREQEGLALRAFQAGETGTFDLFRIRQLRLEAANDEGQAAVAALRARSRLNQARGAAP